MCLLQNGMTTLRVVFEIGKNKKGVGLANSGFCLANLCLIIFLDELSRRSPLMIFLNVLPKILLSNNMTDKIQVLLGHFIGHQCGMETL